MKLVRSLCLSTLGCVAATVPTHLSAQSSLANNTVLIVRHAEKPLIGTGLTPMGEARARAYSQYFHPFQDGGFNFQPDALYAGSDSANSSRPRLTLEPLSKTSGLPLDLRFNTKEPATIVQALRTEKHGTHPLISWRHGEIPELLTNLGGSPKDLLPEGKWPDEVFDWVIVLTFDQNGKLSAQKLVKEQLAVVVRP